MNDRRYTYGDQEAKRGSSQQREKGSVGGPQQADDRPPFEKNPYGAWQAGSKSSESQTRRFLTMRMRLRIRRYRSLSQPRVMPLI
jgi:hypothetical protein